MNAFREFFVQHLPQLAQTYNWPVRPKTKEGLPGFGWHPTSGTMAECIAMKQHLTDAWAKADEIERARLGQWIVSAWGGVRSNREGTIDSYLQAIAGWEPNRVGIPMADLSGVASYSKILSVVDCTKFAIYDARVAAALNAVQLLHGGPDGLAENRRYFPHVPSRNKDIKAFDRWFSENKSLRNNWQTAPRATAYGEYNQLLHDLKAQIPGHEIYQFEMTLFSLGPCLCRWVIGA